MPSIWACGVPARGATGSGFAHRGTGAAATSAANRKNRFEATIVYVRMRG